MKIIHEDEEEVGVVLSAKEYEWLLFAATFFAKSNASRRQEAVCDERDRTSMRDEDSKTHDGWYEIYQTKEVQTYKENISL